MKIVSLLNGKAIVRSVVALSVSVAAACGLAVALGSPALADGGDIPIHYFVSKNGNNSDGKSWATAWNEMNQVQWNLITAYRGDDLTIDGGATSMTYNTGLTSAPQNAPYPVPVRVSTEAGHNGTVIISGNGQAGPGIKCAQSCIMLDGMRTGGIVVTGWVDGVDVAAGTHNYIDHVDIVRNKRGLRLHGGFNNVVRKCTIHDNGLNVLVDPVSPIMSAISTCWIYNSSYTVGSDGVQLGDGTNWTSVMVSNCVIGPGLKTGFNIQGNGTFPESVTNCLFINATRANIYSAKGLMTSRVTSFMTKLNPFGQAHACVAVAAGSTNPPGYDSVSSSIFYGGVVKVSPTIPFNCQNNTQYKTTGNTTLLSPTQVDPLFVTNVGRFPDNVPIRALIQADYSLQANSPAQGTGSPITSVSQLLSQF